MIKNRFIADLKERYPRIEDSAAPLDELISDQLFCPFIVKLPSALMKQMKETATAFHALRVLLAKQPAHQKLLTEFGLIDPGHSSIMMSYDFHIDSKGRLKLIEINTNASFLLMGWEMYRTRNLPFPTEFSPAVFQQDLLNEMKAAGTSSAKPHIRIVDENPTAQRLFIEFLVAREWVRSYGWEASIRDVKDAAAAPTPNLIYNRCTDFLLEDPNSQSLRELFLKKQSCVSPNPNEYLLMADKERMVEWSRAGYLEELGLATEHIKVIRSVLPATYDLNQMSAEEMWKTRKNLFFKPKREFGSKKAFRGASVSRRVFDELAQEDILAQEYVPAPERVFETPEGTQVFKFDLRCHSYQDRVEGVVARVYQGQVTNLRTPLGGFAPVVFE